MLVEGFVVYFRKLLFHPLASFLVSLPQGQVSVLDLIGLVPLSPLGRLLLLVKITDVVEGFLQCLGRFGRSCRNVTRRVLGKRTGDLRRPSRVLFGLVRLHRGINVLCFHRRTSSKSPVHSGSRIRTVDPGYLFTDGGDEHPANQSVSDVKSTAATGPRCTALRLFRRP